MKKAILSIAVLVVLAGAGYWYFVVRQNVSISPDSSFTGEYPVAEKPQIQKTPSELVGVWKPEQFFKWYIPENQFREITASPSEQNTFLKFENGFLCQGQIGTQGEASVCQQRIPTTIQGDVLRVENEAAKWAVKNGKLELIFLERDEKTPKERVILTKYEP